MERCDLIGSWYSSVLGSVITLHEDGTASVGSGESQEQAGWEYVDAGHWKLKLHIAPDPTTPGLEEGAVDVTEYEVTSYAGDVMRATCFDDEHEFVFRRERR